MTDSFEFDFHPVGDGSRSGEAITGQFTINGIPKVIVIDGGTAKSGEEVAQKLEEYYGTSVIDYMVLTHADDDHSSGLRELMDRCEVKSLWMKRPWLYADDLLESFKGNWTSAGLKKELRSSFPIVSQLEEKAIDLGIPIYEPFAGNQFGPFTIVSPSKEFYIELLPQMSRTPEPAEKAVVEGVLLKGMKSVLDAAMAAKGAVFSVFESWNIETLDEKGETSASNESSVILHGSIDDKHLMFTGDAGQKALKNAADCCVYLGLPLQEFSLISVPHHGSRRNVGPSILDRIVGPRVAENGSSGTSGVVSAAKDDDHHPRRVVTNAFRRRGVRVVTTEGSGIRYQHNVPSRAGYSTAAEVPLYNVVEE